jgi:hypothetical protein
VTSGEPTHKDSSFDSIETGEPLHTIPLTSVFFLYFGDPTVRVLVGRGRGFKPTRVAFLRCRSTRTTKSLSVSRHVLPRGQVTHWLSVTDS